MTTQEFLAELKHIETIASTIAGLDAPGATTPAKVAQEKARVLIDWLESASGDESAASEDAEAEAAEAPEVENKNSKSSQS